MTKEQMCAEALERMKKLQLMDCVLRDFKSGVLYESEHMGALYYLNETEQKYVDDFEESSDCIVYHVIHTMTESGELYSMLYVSPCEEEWEYDRKDLESGIVMANVYNATYGFTDMGSIGVRPSIGGLVRTA